MKRAIAILAIAALVGCARSTTIIHDSGGYVDEYYRDLQTFRRSGEVVRFDGKCYSACTMFLSLPPEQICATRRASFGFHKPFGGSYYDKLAWERRFMAMYPEWVVSWIGPQGLTKAGRFMDAEYILKHVRHC